MGDLLEKAVYLPSFYRVEGSRPTVKGGSRMIEWHETKQKMEL